MIGSTTAAVSIAMFLPIWGGNFPLLLSPPHLIESSRPSVIKAPTLRTATAGIIHHPMHLGEAKREMFSTKI
jgi:hypothetical protein